MKILIDTNILINLEDNKVIDKEFSRFYNLAISNGCKVLYHPNAIPKDIGRDKDQDRQKIILSKLEKYESLDNYATPTEDFLNQIKNNKINDIIDNRQLFQLQKGYVDYFVTQDKGIHSKAIKFGLKNRIFDIKSVLSKLENQYIIEIPQHPILAEQSIRNIDNYFETEFFDSLRADYGEVEFNKWLEKCAIKDRSCYSLIVDETLQALLIYNIESVEDHQISGIFEKVLKICTLKVSYDAFGIKLGELFLNKMIQLCLNQKINYLYLTVYEKQLQLIELLEKFGFNRQIFINSRNVEEIRMIKCLNKNNIKSCQNKIVHHPFYKDSKEINKYVIPIRPEFYSTLFKDGKLREPTLFDKAPDSVNEIQGNTIIKAYISHSKNKQLKQGDIVFFYSSKSRQAIEPVGIVESATIVDNFYDLWKKVKKKTVFSQDNLREMLQEKGKLHVIVFRLVTYMNQPIKLSKIKEIDSLKNKMQTITKLKEEDYLGLKNEGYFDKRYIID